MGKRKAQAHWRMLLDCGPVNGSRKLSDSDAASSAAAPATRPVFAFAREPDVVPNAMNVPEDPGAEAGTV
ncbi:hypothetical protein V8J88_18930 [Massilia sp. W12]|uniref:hypothetical protein n=1 Tax=Massilia sp. W12 TaxID=3126507 RepID=UPI0030D0CF0D